MENLNLNVNMENLDKEERSLLMKLIDKATREKSKTWEPKRGEEFWFIDHEGVVCCGYWGNSALYRNMWEYGNVYKTEEDAEFVANKRKFVTKLRRLSEESYTPDSKNPAGLVSYFDNFSKEMGCRISTGEAVRRMAFRFDNDEDAKAALREVGVGNFIKYMCGKKD